MSTPVFEEFAGLRQQSLMYIKNAKEAGQKVVGIYCSFCPQELVLAAGAIPVGLCGTREEPIAAAEEHLPRNLCPLIKSSYGFAVSDTCPFFHFSDLIIGETTCDGKKKMFELLQRIKPVHVMQLPHLSSPAAMTLWVEEIGRLRSWLESELDVQISDDALWQAIDMVNKETQATKALCDLNQQDPPPLTGIELLTVTWSKAFGTDKGEVVSMMESLSRGAGSQTVNPAVRARVLLTGCPVGLGSEKVITLVEELGARVVAMENCSSYKALELLTPCDEPDPIKALAQKYIRIPCSCMSPNEYRLELLERMVGQFSVDAVIDLTWQACHTYNIEAMKVSELVKSLGLPYLHLESDYSGSDLESLKLRIEALLEMV
ncbi:MAG TPA: double-cubane-cluster-containing anaerobic reductase [Syntrophomonadaceae bacterium]|nr:double-cubane-cluster-containing anaerobic reductase [Syntrophomonadaceae bacterium]